MINIDGDMFIQYEKELDESNQILKGYKNYIRDDKITYDLLKKFLKKKEKIDILRKMKNTKRTLSTDLIKLSI